MIPAALNDNTPAIAGVFTLKTGVPPWLTLLRKLPSAIRAKKFLAIADRMVHSAARDPQASAVAVRFCIRVAAESFRITPLS
jgi:hypothetical protein